MLLSISATAACSRSHVWRRKTGHAGPNPAVSWMQCVLAPLGPALREHDHPCVCAACGKRTPGRSGSASRSSDVRRRIVPNCRRGVTRGGKAGRWPNQHVQSPCLLPPPPSPPTSSSPFSHHRRNREALRTKRLAFRGVTAATTISTSLRRMLFRVAPGAMLAYHFPSAGNVSLRRYFCAQTCRNEKGHASPLCASGCPRHAR